MKSEVVQTDPTPSDGRRRVDDDVIRTDGLTKRYGEITALGPIDLAVPRNSIFGFLASATTRTLRDHSGGEVCRLR